ncbi:MAG: rhomboid family intramembrane serine protease [Lachnospiraceae bacterium]|nr:rhomboid family intramembrane serine protease [Lachnospiraceae bacterium]
MPIKKKPIITIGIIGINVLVFIWLSLFGMTEDAGYMLENGAMFVPLVLGNQEYYRLITSMFLHFGFSHLMNNMIMLFFLGSILEEEIGRFKYLFLYFASGLAGNVLSAAMDLKTGEFVVSAGASGAIFGVIGSLLIIVAKNHGHLRTLNGRGMVFMVVCSLYHGFTSTGVDNMAHIGGLAAGILTRDIGGQASTKEMTEAIIARL